MAVDATSYRERGKQAAVNETPGTVTKLTGILEETSRCDYEEALVRYGFVRDKAVVCAPIVWCSRGRWAQLPRPDRRAKTTCLEAVKAAIRGLVKHYTIWWRNKRGPQSRGLKVAAFVGSGNLQYLQG